MERTHIPVLKKEIINYLKPDAGKNFIDCTAGEGGHSIALVEKVRPNGKVLAIEFDPVLSQKLKKKNIEGLKVVNDSYINLKDIVKKEKFNPVNGILIDAGMSSWHIEKSERGFSFKKREKLDMRYNPKRQNITAKEIVNKYPKKELIHILKEYGEEKYAKRISDKIVEERKRKELVTTSDLIEVIKKAVPSFYIHKGIHFATRTFQALRIVVNSELSNLKKVLPQAVEILEPEGRIAVISFHSLEDRIIKNFLKNNKLKVLTKKPITAEKKEREKNPRSRSAKLRIAKK